MEDDEERTRPSNCFRARQEETDSNQSWPGNRSYPSAFRICKKKAEAEAKAQEKKTTTSTLREKRMAKTTTLAKTIET